MSIDSIADIIPRDQYVASASQTAFDYTFPIFDEDDLRVYDEDDLQVKTTDYTVSGVGDDTGGTVTFLTGRTAGNVITIYRRTAIERLTDFSANGPFASSSFNDELDKGTTIMQELRSLIDRSVRMSPLDSSDDDALELPVAASRANKFLAFDANGELSMSSGTGTDDGLRDDLADGTGVGLGHTLVAIQRTDAEIAAAITPTNYQYRPGHVRRYGSTLNSATLQAALNANAGNVVYLEGGSTHALTTAITWPANTHIRVDGDGTAILDASAATLSGSGLIVAQGTLGSSLGSGLAGNVTAGAVSATLNSSPSLSPGDLLILRNPTDASWNADNGSYRQGEFLTVKSVSGAVVTFTSAVIDSYSSGSCTLHKVTPTAVSMKGNIEIRGNVADTANLPTIFIKYGQNNVIDGVKFSRTVGTCLEFSDCYNFEARVDAGKYLTDAGGIQATGVTACGQNGRIYDSVLHGDRHGASTGGGGTVVSRFVKFEHCQISSRTAAAADMHGCVEFCEYVDCHIDGGVNLSGARNKILRNYIYPHASVTSLINFEAAKSIDQTIEGNRFYLRGAADYVVDANASTDINANTVDDGTFRFHRNVIIDEKAESQSYLFIRNNGSTANMELSILDNAVKKTNASFYGNLLAVSAVTGDNFTRLLFAGNQFDGVCGFGIVDDVDSMRLAGSLGFGNADSSSPAFGTTTFEPSEFDFEKRLALTTPATAFTILAVDSGHSFYPSMTAGRADTDITATSGNYLAVGVSASNRRADFGVFGNAAASSKHDKNSKMRFMNSAEKSNQIVDAGEVLALLSIDANADNAGAGSNIGGASQTATVRIAGRMIGNMPSLP